MIPILNSSKIDFSSDDQKNLVISIETKRLRLKSVDQSDYTNLAALFGNATAIEKYAEGKPLSPERVQEVMDTVWIPCWKQQDPYGTFAIYDKITNEFIGQIGLGTSKTPGEVELDYLLCPSSWGKGFGSEAAVAIAKEYVPFTKAKGFLFQGKAVETIMATARVDNEG